MVNDWFPSWLREHRLRHPGAHLPDADSEAGAALYEGWVETFVRRGVHDRDVASLASMRLVGETLRHHTQHFPRLVELALEEYRARCPAGGDATSDRAAAEASSRGCEECGGGGLAVRYRRNSLGQVRDGRTVHPNVTLYCVCAMGRYVRQSHRATEAGREAGRGILDLADHPFLTGEAGKPYHRPPPKGGDDREPAPYTGRTLGMLTEALRADRVPRRVGPPPMTPEQRSFHGVLSEPHAANFADLGHAQRRLVMHAAGDDVLEREAEKLLSRQRPVGRGIPAAAGGGGGA